MDMVGNGREALSAVQRGRYDLVLMDLEMPELDGYEATRQILALPQCRGLAILALTAHATAEEKQRAEEAGMTGFLKKPCRPVELFESIENAIRKSGQTGDSRGDPGRSRTPENG